MTEAAEVAGTFGHVAKHRVAFDLIPAIRFGAGPVTSSFRRTMKWDNHFTPTS